MEALHILLDGSRLPSKDEIGGKAWSLARMRKLGLPTPPAFVLPTRVCHDHDSGAQQLTDEVSQALRAGIEYLERQTGRTFGSGPRPLLVSVRSGAPISMPGMMDTVLNLGMDPEVARALAEESGDPDFAKDTHRRFILGYGRIVLKADLDDEEGSVDDLLSWVRDETGDEVPADPWEQLEGAVLAVLRSWDSRRAKAYRKHMGIPETLGTAVTVQAMVFGNLDGRSGTGVMFTRNPLVGAPEPFGEYLPCGQGEDVVSGERTPLPLRRLHEQMPHLYDELLNAGRVLERECKDIQDIEFTVEQGRLYLLQTRAAKRAPEAAVRLAVALADEGVITPEEAVRRVTADQARQLLRPRLEDSTREGAELLAEGEAGCPGAAAAVALSDADEVVARAERGEQVIFLAHTTSPEDIHAMIAAAAVCTETGGSTSHAAVVCRGLGRPAVVGCGAGTVQALDGREITLDGARGEVFAGILPLRTLRVDEDRDLENLRRWAAELSPVQVVASSAAPDGTLDLDEIGVVEPSAVKAAVCDAVAVTGSVVETDEGVAACLAAGLEVIVTDSSLPVLLSACALAGKHGAVTTALVGPTNERMVAR